MVKTETLQGKTLAEIKKLIAAALVQDAEPEAPESENITPEQVLQYEEIALGLLCSLGKVIKHPERTVKVKDKEKTLPDEYWIFTTVQDVKETLIYLSNIGKIKIGDIDSFMKNRLKGKSGRSVSASLRTAKSVKKRKTS